MEREPLPWDTWRAVASVQTALTGTMAVAALAAPRTLLRLFGVEPAPGTVLFFRAFGASLAFVAVAHHGLKNTRDANAVRTISLANLTEDALLTLLSAQGVAKGTLGKAGWLLIGVFGSEVLLNAWLASKFGGTAPASEDAVRGET